MKCRNDAHSIQVVELASQLRNGRRCLKNRLCCERAETADDLRADRLKLFLQKRIAGRNLVGLRIPIIGRTAFQNVADVHVFTRQSNRFDDLREKLTGATDKRQPLPIFVEAGSFTNENQFGLGISRTEDDIGSMRRQLAALTVADLGADGFKRHAGICNLN